MADLGLLNRPLDIANHPLAHLHFDGVQSVGGAALDGVAHLRTDAVRGRDNGGPFGG
jgi:hypothetical protein